MYRSTHALCICACQDVRVCDRKNASFAGLWYFERDTPHPALQPAARTLLPIPMPLRGRRQLRTHGRGFVLRIFVHSSL